MKVAVVARFGSLGEAESARSALQAAGIDAVLADDEIVALNWLYSNAVGGVKVLVADEDEERAAAILSTDAMAPEEGDVVDDAPERLDEEEEIAEEKSASQCASCGSDDVRTISRLALFGFIAFLGVSVAYTLGRLDVALFGLAAALLIAAFAPSHRCGECGTTWTVKGSRKAVAPALEVADVIVERCPYCGSTEVHPIRYRRLQSIALLFSFAIVFVVPIWLCLPKRKCDQCGRKIWRSHPMAVL